MITQTIVQFERNAILFPLNNFAYAHASIQKLVLLFGVYALYIVLAGLLGWLVFSKNAKNTMQAIVAAVISFVLARGIITEIIRHVIPRNRPFVDCNIHQIITHESGPGFPSGHATALFAIAMAVYFYNKKLGLWLFGVSLLVGIARVAGGVHYPTDIVAGIIVGVASAVAVEYLVMPYID